MASLLLALLVLLPIPARGELPMPAFPGCGEPDREDLCPQDLDETWWLISYVPPAARDGVREAELEVGSGCHADSAWQTTPGRWDALIAVLDSGIEWDEDDLSYKVRINSGELPLPQLADGSQAESYDLDGNGLVNLADWSEDPRVEWTAGGDTADHMLDPSDLIHTAWGEDWDGQDNDGNGYTDDIAGWDFMAHDNDPFNTYEREEYGTHGTGVMRNIGAEGNDGGDIGVCPNCAILPVRVGHAFISDAARVAEAIVFAVDSGAAVINLSIGALSHSAQVDAALAWAWQNDVVVSAAAGDENSFHTNYPSVAPNVLYVHSIRADSLDEDDSAYSYQNFFNCNNFGPRTVMSATGRGCATSAAAMTSGSAGLLVSAGRDQGLDLSTSELNQLLTGAVDDIWLSDEELEIAGSYPSAEGWDPFYGYGKLNVARAVERVLGGEIPPEVEIHSPDWFGYVDANVTSELVVEGRVAADRAGSWSYRVELGTGWDPRDWTELGSGSGSEPLEGELAVLDLAELPPEVLAPVALPTVDEGVLERVERVHAPALTVRIIVQDDQGREASLRRSFFVRDDPDLLAGFPVSVGSSGEASPVLADLDGDAVLEVVLATSGGEVLVLRGDGSAFEGFPVSSQPPPEMELYAGSAGYQQGAVPPGAGDGFIAAPAVGDLDADGTPEVVAATMAGALYAWSEGQLVDGFPRWTLGREPEEFDGDDVWDRGYWAAPTLYDLDDDGTLEIIAASMDGRIYVLDHQGQDWGPYPLELCLPENCGELGAPIVCSPSVGDVDGDGDADIAVGSNETAVDGRFSVSFLLDASSGEALEGWPRTTQGLVGEASLIPIVGEGHPASISLADLDGDGDLELADAVFLAHTQLLQHDGSELFELAHFQDQYGVDANVDEPSLVHFAEHPAFGDLTGDGVPDLVQGGVGTMFLVALPLSIHREYQQPVAAWDGTSGAFLRGWPRQVEDLQFFMAPAVADISGDGKAEAIMVSGGYLVHAFDEGGASPAGWPKFTGQWLIGSPAVGDIDGDGRLDVVAITRGGLLFAWATEGPASGVVEWASVHHDARNTGNYELPLPRQAGPPIQEQQPSGCCRSDGSADSAWLLLPVWLLWGLGRSRGRLSGL